MSQTEIAVVVGVVATAVTFVQILPQIVRLLRIGRTEGVSPEWAAIGTTVNAGWIAYVVAEELWVAIPACLVGTASYGVVLYLLYRNGAGVRTGLLLSAVVAVACVVVQLEAGWTVLGTVLGLSNGLYLGPSVVAAWRSHAPVGVSPLSWVLVALEGVLWGLYGVFVEASPVVVYGVTAALLAGLVLLRLWVTRHRIRHALRATTNEP
ncbi:MAG: PQ-loop domain-containing transporter [Acidimicrobiaceae bacterium]|nr:PQ-loop domain-containing transporter [Acidimicrobiaceae bacterium]